MSLFTQINIVLAGACLSGAGLVLSIVLKDPPLTAYFAFFLALDVYLFQQMLEKGGFHDPKENEDEN